MWKVELNRKKATGTFTDAQGLTAFHYVAVTIRTMSGGQTAWEKDEEAVKIAKKKKNERKVVRVKGKVCMELTSSN